MLPRVFVKVVASLSCAFAGACCGAAVLAARGFEAAQPALLRFVDLAYPGEALERRLQGFVVLRLTLDAAGSVSSSEVLDGDPLLAGPAAANAREWTFPAAAPRQPILVYRFDIDDGVCNDDRRSLFRLRYAYSGRHSMLATVTACNRPAAQRPAPWPDDDRQLVSRPGFDYPEIARRARVQGIVVVRATIAAGGTVERADLLQDLTLLGAPAVADARGWRFEPGRRRETVFVYEFAIDLPLRDCIEVRRVDGLTLPRFVKVAASAMCVGG